MKRIIGFLIGVMFATGVVAQECAFFCEDKLYYDYEAFSQIYTLEYVSQLLADGADIDERDHIGSTPLSVATMHGELEIVEFLLASGADVNTVDEIGATLLHFVMIEHMVNETKRNLGVTTNSTDEYLKIFNLFLSEGLDVNATTSGRNMTPLMYAVSTSTAWGIEALIRAGADIEISTDTGETPLIGATLFTPFEAVVLPLIEAGANVNVTDQYGVTPLLNAVRFHSIDTAQALIDHGADVNTQDMRGYSPLMIAIFKKDKIVLINMLFEVGANPDLRDENGNTALHAAATDAKGAIIPLLAGGADASIRNNDGLTAFGLVRDNPDMIGTESYLALEAVTKE